MLEELFGMVFLYPCKQAVTDASFFVFQEDRIAVTIRSSPYQDAIACVAIAPQKITELGGIFESVNEQSKSPVWATGLDLVDIPPVLIDTPEICQTPTASDDVWKAKRLIRFYELANWQGQENKRKVSIACLKLIIRAGSRIFYAPCRTVGYVAGTSEYTARKYLKQLERDSILIVKIEHTYRMATTYEMDLEKSPIPGLSHISSYGFMREFGDSQGTVDCDGEQGITQAHIYGSSISWDIWRTAGLGPQAHHIWCLLWIATANQEALTVTQLVQATGIPDTTVRTKLGKMLSLNLIERERVIRPETFRISPRHSDSWWNDITIAEEKLGVCGLGQKQRDYITERRQRFYTFTQGETKDAKEA